jgi:hypothetical protein
MVASLHVRHAEFRQSRFDLATRLLDGLRDGVLAVAQVGEHAMAGIEQFHQAVGLVVSVALAKLHLE